MMRRQIPLILFSLCILFPLLSQVEYATDRILVKLAQTDRTQHFMDKDEFKGIQKLFPASEFRVLNKYSGNNLYVVQFEDDQPIEKVIQAYRTTNLFSIVEPDFIGHGGGQLSGPLEFPDDEYFDRQWGLYNDGSFSFGNVKEDSDIDMEMAWEIEKGSSEVIVAVLDSGAKLDHPEIKDRLWINQSEVVSDVMDNDQNGYIDDINGWDFANDDSDPMDDHGHGSNVTGIVGAEANNAIGYAGVDQSCKLMIGKILDEDNSGFYSWWTEAIYYAVDNGAHVINMSVGGSSFSTFMRDAVDYAYANNVTIVACMMNVNVSQPYYPAGYGNTIAVGSTNPDDTRTAPFFWSDNSGSNFGTHIDLVAPGNYIYGLRYNSDFNYNSYWGGTSQATPLVTGVASLLIAQDPSRTPGEIRHILISSAEDLVGDSEDTPGWDQFFGHGRLNAHAALTFGTTATQKNKINIDLRVYPNPVGEYNMITISRIEGKNVRVTAYSLEGKLISAFESIVSEGRIHLPKTKISGATLLRIRQENGREGAVRLLELN